MDVSCVAWKKTNRTGKDVAISATGARRTSTRLAVTGPSPLLHSLFLKVAILTNSVIIPLKVLPSTSRATCPSPVLHIPPCLPRRASPLAASPPQQAPSVQRTGSGLSASIFILTTWEVINEK